MRDVLEPNTASRLKERKSNKVKDYIAMSGPLGVSHMLVFSQSDKDGEDSNVNLRIAKLQRGPTLSFRVLRYSLARDVLNATKRPHSPGKEFATEPMVRPCALQPRRAHCLMLADLKRLFRSRPRPKRQTHDNHLPKPLSVHQGPICA
jgi:hypothetical protein